MLRCQCGLVQGSVGPISPWLNKRIVCMCRDCQAFAHYLGRADQMLDLLGGTEVAPVHPGRIHFTQGQDKLACVRLSDDGLRRWYTTCCKTPVANTHPKNWLPFASLHQSIFENSDLSSMGPVYARINSKKGHGTFKAIVSTLRFLTVGIIRGLKTPWPFPDVAPTIGTDREYDLLIEQVKKSSNRTRDPS
jgi:hypothetical protein